jgi:5-methylcytosine-specific restriction endonuclease McrA
MSYDFICSGCKKLVHCNSLKQRKSYRKGRCTRKCDGIKRDAGGYALDPSLRKVQIRTMNVIRKANSQLKNLGKIESFYDSNEWRKTRYQALKIHGSKCQACKTEVGPMHVDHIKPRSKFPELQLEVSNLQILCEACNLGKGNWDETDWRKLK